MIPTQDAIVTLADRIEQAYRRRYPRWSPIGMTAQPWETTAARLLAASSAHRNVPVDPEFLVAAQPLVSGAHDPWSELASERAIRRYIHAVRQIVGQLRDELRQEVRTARRQMLRGVTLDELVETENPRLSPLTRYILALRAGRSDLSDQMRSAAENQHQSCPLYRLAARNLIPVVAYPAPMGCKEDTPSPSSRLQFSLN